MKSHDLEHLIIDKHTYVNVNYINITGSKYYHKENDYCY